MTTTEKSACELALKLELIVKHVALYKLFSIASVCMYIDEVSREDNDDRRDTRMGTVVYKGLADEGTSPDDRLKVYKAIRDFLAA